jgi:hypothetical protein
MPKPVKPIQPVNPVEPAAQPRVATRSSNADRHPGSLVPKRKRRTKEEMNQARAAEQAAKDEKARLKKEKVDRIAALEDKMATDDAVVNKRASGRQLERTYFSSISEKDLDSSGDESATPKPEVPPSRTKMANDDEGDLTEKEEPPKKKTKKIPVRETIKAARKEPASRNEKTLEKDRERVGDGKKQRADDGSNNRKRATSEYGHHSSLCYNLTSVPFFMSTSEPILPAVPTPARIKAASSRIGPMLFRAHKKKFVLSLQSHTQDLRLGRHPALLRPSRPLRPLWGRRMHPQM